MSTRIQKAFENHKKKYNCSQAVACAFCDLVGTEEKAMFQIMEGYGLGMGGMEGTCGAVCGAIAILGMKNSTGNLENADSKASTYKLSKQLVDSFKEKNGSVICRELKGVDTKEPLRSCDGCIEDAALILEEILTKQDF